MNIPPVTATVSVIGGSTIMKSVGRNMSDKCRWLRQFDGHFAISCPTGERANGQFKGKDNGARWEFKFCPYCGREIEEYFTGDSV